MQQGAAREGVTNDGQHQRQKPQEGEEQRKQHIQPVFWLLHVEEAPAPRALHLIWSLKQHGQEGHQGGEQPAESQQSFDVMRRQSRRVEDGPGDSNAALHSHGAPQEQRAQTVEHHADSKDAAHNAMRVKGLPLPLGAVHVEHQGAVDEVTQQVGDHQAAGKHQEGGFGLDPEPVVGLDQDEESKAVGKDAHSHGDGRGCDGQMFVAAGSVGGSELRSV